MHTLAQVFISMGHSTRMMNPAEAGFEWRCRSGAAGVALLPSALHCLTLLPDARDEVDQGDHADAEEDGEDAEELRPVHGLLLLRIRDGGNVRC